ncbi:MAG: helix-turn-helix transcriptional regulator [bacterium]
MNGGQNRLWLARRRRNLGQKHVAHLLGHSSLGQVSRYETGLHLPTLQTALKLETILGLPVRAMFPELYLVLQSEIRNRASVSRGLSEKLTDISVDDYCSYEGLLVESNVPMDVRQKIHRHAAFLINKMNRAAEEPMREGGSSE